MIITLDIETLPTEDTEIISSIAEGITPPGNVSKAETIAAWEKDKKPTLVKEAVLKTSFDGTYGRILCIGWAVGDEDPHFLIGDEKEIFAGFMGVLANQHLNNETVFVGHNIHGFDLRFLWQRCVINGVKMNPVLKAACKAKAWDACIGDTMLMWHPDRDRRISLDRLCKALGVKTSKGDMDGSKVYETYLAGDLKKIGEYCREDVRAVRECYQRMTGV